MDLKQEALEFIEGLQSLYIEQRNLAALLPSMDEYTSWIGTGKEELCRNLADAKAAFSLEIEKNIGNFTVTEASYDARCLAENVCVVYGEITAKSENPEYADLYNRLTAVCVSTKGGMRLAHLHLSAPDVDQEKGCFFVKSDEVGRRETLRLRVEKAANELRERNSQLEALTESIPGGVHQCKCDEGLTFLSMSSSFQTLVGYSQEEIRELFHNHFTEMIYKEDLPLLKAEMEEQLLQGDNLELEYRIQRADGELRWILDQGKRTMLADGTYCFYCVLMDITRQKIQREEFRLTLERHQIILDQSSDIIFEWDMVKDDIIFSTNWRKKFGYEPISDVISVKIPQSKNIHPDDMLSFIKLMKDSLAGAPYSETEFRIRDIMGHYKWHRIRATVLYDSKGRPIKAVGVILDIDTDKRQRDSLIEQTQRDPLTNLYNKTALRELATRQINESPGGSYQALLIIDIDNFKGVNDTYGHLCGDSLLSDVAGVLKSHFRNTDLLGRIGGDEFLVYLPEIQGKEKASEKVQSLLMALRKLRPIKGAPPISCSIGVALFPQKGADYFALYKCADVALYQIKAQGKNNFVFYDPVTNKGEIPSGLSSSAVGGIDSEGEGAIDSVGEKLAQYTFRMLYSAIDVSTAVSQLLEIVGRAYDVSRVYIFESSEDLLKCSNTFEWCNTAVLAEMDNLQNIDYRDDLGNYQQNFDKDNLFYCRDIKELPSNLYDILAPQEICSILQCAIVDDGIFRGFVGFDECRENRSWTKAQISSLTLISNVLATFLLKLRFKEGRCSVIRPSKE